MMLELAVIASLCGAPAPKAVAPAKPAPTTCPLKGNWDARWNGTDCAVELAPGGVYRCVWLGEPWEGTYAFDAATGLLTVRERPKSDRSFHINWKARLGANLATVGEPEPGHATFGLRSPRPTD